MARPSKYLAKHCEALIEHMRGGLSYESFAGVIGVHRDTLYEWESVHPAFSDAKKRGEALSLLWWEKLGKAAVVGEPVKMPDGRMLSFKNFNTTMWIFAMKNRHGWRDRVEHKAESSVTIKNSAPQLDQSLTEIREILEARECSRQTKPLSLVHSGGLLPQS